MGETALAGRAVGDIVHLLAELIENAVSFSPPYTQAQVSGHRVAHGYAIEIEDRGLGMTDEILSSINERVTNPPEFNLSSLGAPGPVRGRPAGRPLRREGLAQALLLRRHHRRRPRPPRPDRGDRARRDHSTTAPRGLPVSVGAAGITATSYGDVPARVRDSHRPRRRRPSRSRPCGPRRRSLRSRSSPPRTPEEGLRPCRSGTPPSRWPSRLRRRHPPRRSPRTRRAAFRYAFRRPAWLPRCVRTPRPRRRSTTAARR